MGLFSALGKLAGGIVRGVGKVAKVGLGAVKIASSLGVPIPLGGLAGKLAGQILAAKAPMARPAVNVARAGGSAILRAKTPMVFFKPGISSTARAAQMSPVMPGGAVATPTGIAPASGGTPPLQYGKRGSSSRKRKRKSTARKRSSSSRRRGGRKLKFGSPAWRKKYLSGGKKKRRTR